MRNHSQKTTDALNRRVSKFVSGLSALLISMVSTSTADALDIGFKYVESGGDTLETALVVIDSLPEKLHEYIDKGVPISFEYNVELWKVRSGWFDSRAVSGDIAYKIRYDTWEKRYTVLEITPLLVVENILPRKREALEMILSSGKMQIPVDYTNGDFYLIGKISVKVMTLSNFREVESWLKGEISEVEKPNIRDASNRIGEFLFDTALKVTGLENIAESIRTSNFQLDELPLKTGDGLK